MAEKNLNYVQEIKHNKSIKLKKKTETYEASSKKCRNLGNREREGGRLESNQWRMSNLVAKKRGEGERTRDIEGGVEKSIKPNNLDLMDCFRLLVYKFIPSQILSKYHTYNLLDI